MSYEKTIWKNGDIITADKLNKIEKGIQDILCDSELNDDSINPVQNRVIKMAFNNLSTQINAIENSPLKAVNAADMININKIYVYVGNESDYIYGNWYYYDGINWVNGGVYNAIALNTDDTLTQLGQAADAKKTGDEISDLKSDFDQVVPGLSEEAKAALLACFAHVAWIGTDGQDYYDALEEALYDEPVPINPFENAEYGIGGWSISINPTSRTTVTQRNELENRAGSVVPISCLNGSLVAKTGYNINAHFLTGLTYGTWTYDIDGSTKEGYLDGLYDDTTHYQWDTEKTIPREAMYACVSVKKTDNTDFTASEIAALYGTAFEYVEVQV